MLDQKEYCTIYLARHGETEANVNKICSGHSDSPLTLTGIAQARDLGKRLQHIHFDEVFSSDLWRAKRTASLASLDRNLAVKTNELLREKNLGEFEGLSYEAHRQEIRNVLGQMKSISEKDRARLKVGLNEESEEEVASRFIRGLREIASAYIGKNILVVSHGGSMRIFLTHLGFGTREEMLGSVKNTAYAKIKSDGLDFFVEETYGIEKKNLS